MAVINYFQKYTPKDNPNALNDLYFREKDERLLKSEIEDIKKEL